MTFSILCRFSDDEQNTDNGPGKRAEHNGEKRALPSEEAADHAHELDVAAAHGLDVPQFLPYPADGKERTAAQDKADEGIEERGEIRSGMRQKPLQMKRQRVREADT